MKESTVLKKCPNCGADIKHYYNHRCPYCRTYLHMTDETIKTINNCDIRIDDVEIEKDPLRARYILTARGWSTPKFHYLEEMQENSYVVSGDDIGKRVGFRMEIPYEVLCKNDFREIQSWVERCMPPELCNGLNEEKIVEKCYRYFIQRLF